MEEQKKKNRTSSKAVNKYMKKAYDRLSVFAPKDDAEKYRVHAQQRGESMNGFINRAIKAQIERDEAGSETE